MRWSVLYAINCPGITCEKWLWLEPIHGHVYKAGPPFHSKIGVEKHNYVFDKNM
jgi:hypothetical protein